MGRQCACQKKHGEFFICVKCFHKENDSEGPDDIYWHYQIKNHPIVKSRTNDYQFKD